MSDDRFYERRHSSRKKRDKKSKKSDSFIPYQKKYTLGKLLSDVGNRDIVRFFESGLLQPKLNVSQSGDIYEKEADRIAKNIVNTNSAQVPKVSRVQSKAGTNDLSVQGNTETIIKGLKGKGNPLNKPIKEYFEPRFGIDLGNVRIHTDSNANQLAKSINAKAFTYGNDIVFSQGQYLPNTLAGNRLIAHELTHTIQQSGGLHRDVVQKQSWEESENRYVMSPVDYAKEVIAEIDKIRESLGHYVSNDAIAKAGLTVINDLPIDTILEVLKIIKNDFSNDYYDMIINYILSLKDFNTPKEYADSVILSMIIMKEDHKNNYAKTGWDKIIHLPFNELLLTLKIIYKECERINYDFNCFDCLCVGYEQYCYTYHRDMLLKVRNCFAKFCNSYFDEYEKINVDEKFIRLKTLLSKVDKEAIDKFNEMTKGTWANILEYIGRVGIASLFFGALGPIAENIYSRFFKADKSDELNQLLNDNFSPSGSENLTVDDLLKVVALFQYKTVILAEELILKSIEIATAEKKRYNNNEADLTALYTLLTEQYAQNYNEADLRRAEALFNAVDNDDLHNHYGFDYLPSGYEISILDGIACDTIEETAKRLAKYPADLVDIVIFESIRCKKAVEENKREGRSWRYNKTDYADYAKHVIKNEYPELVAAQEIDAQNDENIINDIEKYPILMDIHINFRDISREYTNNKKGFKNRISDELTDSIKSGYDTLQAIYNNPEKVWEFAPLIQLSMNKEGITEQDNVGSIIWDHYEDIDFDKSLRSFALAGAGIILGVLGFFTGGSTWAAIALGVAGATISTIDFFIERETYILKSNAVKAILDQVLSEDPGVLGIVFAIVSLVLDVADIGVAAMKIVNAAEGINNVAKNADDISELYEAAGKQYDELFESGELTPVLKKDEWVESVVNAVKTNKVKTRTCVLKKLWYNYTGKEVIGEIHHGLPEEFADWFAQPGRNLDVNNPEYFFDLPADKHRFKSGNGIHTNSSPLKEEWNSLWRRFIADNPDASVQQILDELDKMVNEAGITQYRAIKQ